MPMNTEQGDQTDATHRLKQIIVQEVSLVDRAANKRRFLVIKRDATMAKPVKKEDAAAATAEVADAAGDGPGGAAPTSGGMQQQVKEGLTAGLADIAEKIVAIANQVDQVEATDQPADPAVPTEIMSQISDVAKAITDLAVKFGGAPAAEAGTVAASADGAGGAPAPAAGGAEKAADEPPTEAEKAAVKEAEEETAQKGLDATAHQDLVTKSVAKRLGIQLEAANVVVAKVGRKMAKKRLEALGKAIDMLIGLMKELRVDAPKAALGKAEKREVTAAPATGTPEIAALLKNAEMLLEVAQAQGTELTGVRADLAKANAEIAKLKKATGESNVIALEKSGGSAPGGSVAWPLDMNQRGQRAAAK